MKKAIGLVLVLVLLVAAFSGCGGKSLDVFSYITVEYAGLNGTGTANVELSDEFENVLFTAAGYEDGADPFQYLALYGGFDYEITPNEGLSNGDKVTVRLETNDEILKQYKISFKSKEQEFTVEGLQEGKNIDLFADVELVLEGASPFLTVRAESRSADSFLKSVNYKIEDSRNRRIGDEVVVVAHYAESTAVQEGYLIESNEKTFVIENADKIVETFEEIPDDFWQKLLSEAGDQAVTYVAKNGATMAYLTTDESVYSLWQQSNVFTDPVLQKAMLVVPKPNTNAGATPGSTLYIAATCDATDKNAVTRQVAFYVEIPGIILREDGMGHATFEKATAYHLSKVTDPAVVLQNIGDKNKADNLVVMKDIEPGASSSDDADASSSAAVEGETIYTLQDAGYDDPQYMPAILLSADGKFAFAVNLLSGMGKMTGTYTEEGGKITCTITDKNFGGSYVGADLASFTLTIDGDKATLGDMASRVGASENDQVYTKTAEKPASLN